MGKTTISNYLGKIYHLPILDADLYAREAVESGSEVLQEIVERYGRNILLSNGQLDRRRLGEIIFSALPERIWIEQRIHPYVRDRLEKGLERLSKQSHAVAVVVIPLLFEARMTDLVTEIWVVKCPQDQQVERLIQRELQLLQQPEYINLEQIHARINSQMAIERKIAQADIVLDNSSTLDALFQQVDLALAGTAVSELATAQQQPSHNG